MGFEPQIRMIVQNIRPDRQTVLFSATFPKQIEKLAKSILKFPLEIVVGERTGGVNKDITQYVEVHEDSEKFMRLLQLLGVWYERGNILIFVDTQDKCDTLFQELLKYGYPCVSLHGGKDQFDRDHTLYEFKTLIKSVMVATSVAGRGLDVPETVCVVNYNSPNHFEDYVHRVGRTGRAGRKGTAYTFISSDEEQYANILMRALERQKEVQTQLYHRQQEHKQNMCADADAMEEEDGADPIDMSIYDIPRELQQMADRFKMKVERGEAHWASSGFVGNKGFTFDESEMNESQKLASMQRRAYEIEQGIVTVGADGKEANEGLVFSDDEEDDRGADGAAAVGSSVANTTETLPASAASSSVSSAAQSTAGAPKPEVAMPADPLERARLVAASLQNKSSLPPTTQPNQSTTAPPLANSEANMKVTFDSLVSGGGGSGMNAAGAISAGSSSTETALLKAKEAAMKVISTGRAGMTPAAVATAAGSSRVAAEPQVMFSEELEFNDYPAQVRARCRCVILSSEV